MGYYLTTRLIGSTQMCLVGYNSSAGFRVLKPGRFETLMAELKRTSRYQDLCKKLFKYGRELETASYPHLGISLKEAKSRYYNALVIEELEYNFIKNNTGTDDFDFLLSKSGIVAGRPPIAGLIFECFLEDSKFLGVEVVGDSLRFFKQLSKIGSLFSSQRTGDTVFSISTRDIKDIEVSPDCIGLPLKDATSFVLSRDRYKTPSSSQWQYRNGTSVM